MTAPPPAAVRWPEPLTRYCEGCARTTPCEGGFARCRWTASTLQHGSLSQNRAFIVAVCPPCFAALRYSGPVLACPETLAYEPYNPRFTHLSADERAHWERLL